MPNYANSQSQIVFVQKESTFGIIPNSSGTATVANSNACRIISAALDSDTALIPRPDKTSSLTELVGTRGRSQSGSNSVSMSLAGSGAAGTAPDMGPFLEASFGKAGTVVASTSVTYALEDNSVATAPSLAIYNYRDPSTMEQQCAFGSIVKSTKFDFGSDVATVAFDVESVWTGSSAGFSASDTTQKGGLTSFPARPSSPATNGNFAVGFLVTMSIDGNAFSQLRSGSMSFDWQRSLRHNICGTYYGGQPQQLRRRISLDFVLDDDDSANLNTLKGKAISKATCNITIVIGTVAGNIWTFNFPNAQLPAYRFTDSDPVWGLNWSGVMAKGTNKDECTLVCT